MLPSAETNLFCEQAENNYVIVKKAEEEKRLRKHKEGGISKMVLKFQVHPPILVLCLLIFLSPNQRRVYTMMMRGGFARFYLSVFRGSLPY